MSVELPQELPFSIAPPANSLTGTLGPVTGALTGAVVSSGSMVGTVGSVTGALVGVVESFGALDGTLGVLTGSITSTVDGGVLGGDIGPLTAAPPPPAPEPLEFALSSAVLFAGTVYADGRLTGDTVAEWTWPDLIMDPAETYVFEVDIPAGDEMTLTPHIFAFSQLTVGDYPEVEATSAWHDLGDESDGSWDGAFETLTITIGPGLADWDDAVADDEMRVLFEDDGTGIVGMRLISGVLLSEPAPAEEVPPAETDLEFEDAAYDYTGDSLVEWNPAPMPVPDVVEVPPQIRRVHHSVTAPTMDDGRPVFTAGIETITPWVDRLRVTVGGKDVTWFRDVPTVIGGWSNLDPYGDASATLTFPGITEFETPGVGDLDWLAKTKRVVINRVVDDLITDREDPLFVGLLARDPVASGPLSVTVEGQYIGRMGRLLHQPYLMHNPSRDLYDHLERIHRHIYRADFQFVGSQTGIDIRSRGDRAMTRLGAVDMYLGLGVQADGDSYTLLPDRSVAPNAMRLQQRTMTTVDVTVCAGAHGIKVGDLASDPASNRVYGEGQSHEGARWRGSVYPRAGYDDDPPPYPMPGSFGLGTTDAETDGGDGIRLLTRRLWGQGLLDRDDAGSTVFDAEVRDAVNELRENLGLPQNGLMNSTLWGNLYGEGFNNQSFQGAHFEPLAAATETVQVFRSPGGAEVGFNDAYDRAVMPVEEYVSYGENVTKRQGKKNARSIINRAEVRVGTITLTTDPWEMSRFEIRAGMTLRVRNLMGTGFTGVKFYISSVEVDWSGGTVTLAVATSPLHFVELQTIRQRQVEARQSPSKRAIHMFRSSRQVKDTVLGWESEGPSGVVPRRQAPAGEWTVFQTVACERGTLAEMRFVADNPTPFYVMVCGQHVPASLMNQVIGNPATMRGGEAGRSVSDAVANGTHTITSAAANFQPNDEGRDITGDVPDGATISEVVNESTILVSSTTGTGTSLSLHLGASSDYNAENTFQYHAEWLQRHLLAQAYGDPEQPGGYWPKLHTNDQGKRTTHPPTGVLFDDASQAFVTVGCFLWVYVWPVETTMFHGRLKLVPED